MSTRSITLIASVLDFLFLYSSLFGAITIRVGYGIDVDEHKATDYLGIAQRAMETFSLAFLPGKYLVESVSDHVNEEIRTL